MNTPAVKVVVLMASAVCSARVSGGGGIEDDGVATRSRPPGTEKPANRFGTSTFFGIPPDELSVSKYLQSPGVQKDLALTDQQFRTLNAVERTYTARLIPLQSRLRWFPPDEKPALLAELEPLEREYTERLLSVLTRRQRARLDQITLQNAGLRALRRPDVAERINLSPEQYEAITAILDRIKEREKSLWQGEREAVSSVRDRYGKDEGKATFRYLRDPEYRAIRKRTLDGIGKIREDAERQILRILTKKQRSRFFAMAGKAFDVKSLRSPGESRTRPAPDNPSRPSDAEEPASK